MLESAKSACGRMQRCSRPRVWEDATEAQTGWMSLLTLKIRSQFRNVSRADRAPRAAVALFMAAAGLLAAGTPVQGQSSPSPAISSPAASTALSGVAGVTDEPIFPGEIVNVGVYNAPDFSTVARVSQGGDIALPYVGIIHLAGLSSADAADLVVKRLKDGDLVPDPRVMVTVDSTSTGITVLGEVKVPGVYSPPGKHMLSDILAMAGGLTTNTGRIIEISSESAPDQKALLPWDPTMHNTSMYDRIVSPGSRVLVKPCGVVYVGGNVSRPGAYPICTSQVTTVSQIVALASGAQISSYQSHTILVRTRPDGTRIVQQIDIGKVLKAKAADPLVQADDILYIPLSGVKYTLRSLPNYIANLGTATLNVYR